MTDPIERAKALLERNVPKRWPSTLLVGVARAELLRALDALVDEAVRLREELERSRASEQAELDASVERIKRIAELERERDEARAESEDRRKAWMTANAEANDHYARIRALEDALRPFVSTHKRRVSKLGWVYPRVTWEQHDTARALLHAASAEAKS